MSLLRAVRLALVVLATARLIRLVTTDDLGFWWVVRPLRHWANRRDQSLPKGDPELDDEPDTEAGWRSKVASAADCPWCIGFHLGWLVMLGEVLTGTRAFGWLRPLWTFALAALALNAGAVATGKRLQTLP